ncbi:MAG TPA: DUF948 domain-containing protein [Methylomirabilota bacterium]|jgi:uncharacterized protein YoxC|nr:DUF948 domain-containing protein [Methylomirabilota bacterium]
MTPFELIIALCAVAATVALVATLRALRKTAGRADEVLHLVEREIRPMASQIESLAEEVRTLAQNANANMDRLAVVVHRADEISYQMARFAVALSGFTRLGSYTAVAAGVKRGLDVFIKRLRSR